MRRLLDTVVVETEPPLVPVSDEDHQPLVPRGGESRCDRFHGDVENESERLDVGPVPETRGDREGALGQRGKTRQPKHRPWQ